MSGEYCGVHFDVVVDASVGVHTIANADGATAVVLMLMLMLVLVLMSMSMVI